MRMDKSKENTLIYVHKYVFTHSPTHINTDTQIHIYKLGTIQKWRHHKNATF